MWVRLPPSALTAPQGAVCVSARSLHLPFHAGQGSLPVGLASGKMDPLRRGCILEYAKGAFMENRRLSIESGLNLPKPVSRLLFVVVLILAALVLGDLNDRMTRARELEQDLAFLKTQIADLNAEISDLEAGIAHAEGDDAVVDWAHKDAKWVRPGEKLVFVKPAGDANVGPTPVARQTQMPPSNLEVWLEVLFGD